MKKFIDQKWFMLCLFITGLFVLSADGTAGPLTQKHKAVVAVLNTQSGGSHTISYGGTNNAASVITGTTLTLTVPSAVSSGNMMYVSLCNDSGEDWVIHADWTFLTRIDSATSELAVAYRIATVADESDSKTYDFTVTGSTELIGSIMFCTKSGGSFATPSTNQTDAATAQTLVTTAVNPTDGSLLLSFWGNDDSLTTTSDPTSEGMTEFIPLVAADPKLIGFYQEYASAASNVTKSTTWTTATGDISSILVIVEAN